MKSIGRRLSIATMMVALVCSFGVSKATPVVVATGSIEFTYLGFDPSGIPGPEVLKYINDGCVQNYTQAVFQAVVDLRPFRGRKIRVSAIGADTTLGAQQVEVYSFNGCTPQDALTAATLGMRHAAFASPASPAVFVANFPFIALDSFHDSEVNLGTPPNINQRFKIEAA